MRKILFSVILILIFAVPAFAKMTDRPMKGHGEGHGQMMASCHAGMTDCDMMCLEHRNVSGLNDEQAAKLKPLYREKQKKQIRYKADLKLAEIELEEIMEVKDFDLEKASAAVKKIESIKTAHHLEILRIMKDVRAVLNDDQFKTMCKMMPAGMEEKKPFKKPVHKSSPKKPVVKQPATGQQPQTQDDGVTHQH